MLITPKLVSAILAQYQLDPDSAHGLAHWGRVLENGLKLAEVTGADQAVVTLFAVFHDACRINENKDPGHGARGAELAYQLRGKAFSCSDAQMDLLVRACSGHTNSPPGEKDVTVLTCWDADRLDLGRVGKTVDPTRLCTGAAMQPDLIERATKNAVTGYRTGTLMKEEDLHIDCGQFSDNAQRV